MADGLPRTALWVVLLIPFVKIASTSLSIGSGGSGGIFGPGMVIGGFLGLALWRVLEGAPGVPAGPAPFMVVGMIACFGSIAHAPLGLMVMVAEMTGSLSLLPPAMIAIGLATLIVGERTIYESQLRSRADAPAHRAAFGLPLLSSVMVADVMTPPPLIVPEAMPIDEACRLLASEDLSGAPVLDDAGDLLGVPRRTTPDTRTRSRRARPRIARTPPFPPTGASTSPSTHWYPQVLIGGPWSTDRGWSGSSTWTRSSPATRRALRRSLKVLADVKGSSVLIEVPIGERSPFAGITVAAAPWPRGSVALSIDRHSQLLAPRPDTTLQAGDVIVAVAPVAAEAELRRRLDGATA